MHLILLLLLSAISQECAATTTPADHKWVKGYNSLLDYDLVTSQTVGSKMKCLALASRLAVVSLVRYDSGTGACALYRYREPNPDFTKCRDLSPMNHIVWYLSTQLPEECWTTVQHRVSDSVSFYRVWSDYKTGFGEGPNGNFWIGLDSLNSLTSVSGGRKLRFLMKAWNGSESWAQYSSFSVGPESDQYRLSVSGFTSSHSAIGDSFSATTGSKFTTKDRDNDGVSGNAAIDFIGAWWFGVQSRMHPNGPFTAYPAALSTH